MFGMFPCPHLSSADVLGSGAETYACRYTLGEVKQELLEAMGLNTEAEGSAMQFLRRGYKTTTWWEEDEQLELSDAWRS
jgi:hypothetical protein